MRFASLTTSYKELSRRKFSLEARNVCLIVFAWRAHPAFDLVVGANRDEFYARPSAPAHYWTHAPEVLAGRDLLAGGTWLGVTRSGRFAAITNFRDPGETRKQARSRGELTSAFLESDVTPAAYATQAWVVRGAYNGFNLLIGDAGELWYVGTRAAGPSRLAPGLYGISNHVLDTPWPKLERSKARFAEALAQPDPEPATFALLGDRDLAADEELPDTGVGVEWERALSAPFIATESYGTRAATFLARCGARIRFVEREFEKGGVPLAERRFEM